MPVTRAAKGRISIDSLLEQRYGQEIGRAALRPGPILPPPGNGPGDVDDRLREPTVHLPPAPAWVRAWSRLGYGIFPGAREAFNALGGNDIARYEALVEQQLAWESIDDSAMDARLSSAGYTTLGKSLTQLWADHVASGAPWEVRMLPAWESQRASVMRAAFSKRQLQERMTTFWHDHFHVTGSDYDAGPVFVHHSRDVIRPRALGNFRAMLEAVASSTAMLYYLDNRSNTRSGPNENFARELLELHTFGAENYLGFMNPGQVPPCPEDPSYPIGYTDVDVYETAAAFTGWTLRNGHWQYPSENDGSFVYRAAWHDTGPKFVLGMYLPPEQPAMKDGRDVLDRIASHPRVARFICRKLVHHFAGDAAPASLVESAATLFRQRWQDADQIRVVLRHILRSPEVREARQGKRRRPSEVIAAALRAAGSTYTLRPAHAHGDGFMWRLAGTGHVPYDWPAPNGYADDADAWSGANSFGMTWRMLSWLTETSDDDQRLLPVVEDSRAGVASWTAANLVDFWCLRLLGRPPAPARLQMLRAFMAQGASSSYVIADSNTWSGSDLRAHYNHDRLRSMVSLLLMSPEFATR
ncbi:DUF1800 domain-containing protein [Luteimonas arsenica]|uniref:DUF1800 domain-containing protein n=1 Tax=Luteimonas arsenica TaxID=1586242 RepID=UPI0014055C68|nr:DUF1800 domain-containing protein [Luteimonas arsenica]